LVQRIEKEVVSCRAVDAANSNQGTVNSAQRFFLLHTSLTFGPLEGSFCNKGLGNSQSPQRAQH
jgi:hypothetical protein